MVRNSPLIGLVGVTRKYIVLPEQDAEVVFTGGIYNAKVSNHIIMEKYVLAVFQSEYILQVLGRKLTVIY
jgi:hypothetical protein